jgi:RNA polymerase sigma-70 factor (ECF subfamily)
MLGNHEDAEEAWQDIFMRVWQKIELWDPLRGNFQSWLNQIAKNAIIDVFRKKNRLREVLQYGEEDGVEEMLTRFRDETPLPDEQLEAQEVRELIELALNQMTKKNHRVAWVLRHLEGMSIAEISEVLNQKENTVKVWIFRATKELRQILVRRGFDYQLCDLEAFDEVE